MKLTLKHNGVDVLRTNVTTTVGRDQLKSIHPDATFLSHEQFRLVTRVGAEQWSVEPIPGAVNATLLDGRPLTELTVLRSGSTLAVGNVSKGIAKLPLVVALQERVITLDTDSRIDDMVPVRSVPEVAGDTSPWITPERLATATRLAKGLGSVAGALLGAIFSAKLSSGTGTRVYKGHSLYGDLILTVENTRVYQGHSTYSTPILTIDGDMIRRGNSEWGDVIATLDGDKVREGKTTWGNVIATIDGSMVREGSGNWGNAIAYVDGGRRMAGAAAAAYLLRY